MCEVSDYSKSIVDSKLRSSSSFFLMRGFKDDSVPIEGVWVVDRLTPVQIDGRDKSKDGVNA